MAMPSDGWGGRLAEAVRAGLRGAKIGTSAGGVSVVGCDRSYASVLQRVGDFRVHGSGAVFDSDNEIATGEGGKVFESIDLQVAVTSTDEPGCVVALWPAVRLARYAMHVQGLRDVGPSGASEVEYQWNEEDLVVIAKVTLQGHTYVSWDSMRT